MGGSRASGEGSEAQPGPATGRVGALRHSLGAPQVSGLSPHCLLWAGKGLPGPFPCRGELTAPPEKQPSPLQSAPHLRSPPGSPQPTQGGSQVCPEPRSELTAQSLLLSCFLHKEVGKKANRQVSPLTQAWEPGPTEALRKWEPPPMGEGLFLLPRVRITRPSPTRMLPQSW